MIRTGLIFSITAIIGMCAVNFWAMPQIPEGQVPVHWGIDGTPDRYGDRSEAIFGLWIVPISTVFTTLILAIAPRLDPNGENLMKSRKAYIVIWCSVMILLLGVHAGVAMLMVRSVTQSPDANEFVRFVIAASAILFIVKGNYLPKTRSNWFLGLRTPWTLSSDITWEKTHRLAGRLFMLAGFICLIGAFVLDGGWLIVMLLGTLLPATLISVVYSYFVWRNAPDKRIGTEYIV
jgi:uncharacterized membrane protein